ncbi:MAG TPA: DoxX family protein [Nitrososphaeraceae archaeon]|jgi:putative oxidoreductase|nr:DoxX family protein [Nitrososphaeraceae archaeon]
MSSIFSYGLLPIRIMVGMVFIAHGIPKFYDTSGGYGFFQSINLPPELFIPIALLEVIGGLAILFGILTRIASALFIIEMIGAIVTAKLSKGFVGGYEFELLLISICLTLLILGPGKISIENYLLKREIFPKGKQLYQKTTNTEIR